MFCGLRLNPLTGIHGVSLRRIRHISILVFAGRRIGVDDTSTYGYGFGYGCGVVRYRVVTGTSVNKGKKVTAGEAVVGGDSRWGCGKR